MPPVRSDDLLPLGPLGAEARAALAAVTGRREFRAQDYLLEGGRRAEWCFFIERGLVREFYIGESGDEHTRSFIAAGQVTGSLLDLLSSGPAVTYIQALEDTRTLAFRYRDFDALTARFAELERLARQSAEALAVRKTRREHEMLALSAAQRYQRFVSEHAELDARISRKLLASYLGITPEHLSRLRRAPSR
jgi:CRP-like cAMP-binding protein